MDAKGSIEIGEKIAIISKNNLSFVEIVFAVASSGVVSVPINFRLAADEFVYIINNSDSKILFIEKDYEEIIKMNQHQMPKVEKVVIIDTNQSEWGISYPSFFENKASHNDLAHLLKDDDDCMICYRQHHH